MCSILLSSALMKASIDILFLIKIDITRLSEEIANDVIHVKLPPVTLKTIK